MFGVKSRLKRINRNRPRLGLTEAVRLEVNLLRHTDHIEIWLRKFNRSVRLRHPGSDILVFWQMFINRELELNLPRPPSLIIDAGANIGLSSLFLAHQYPEASVIAIEPDAANMELLRFNCRGIEQIVPLPGGLWHRSAHARICNPEVDSWAFQLKECAAEDPGAVRCWTVHEILQQAKASRVGLLKLDIEEEEHNLFIEQDTSWLDCIDNILVEFHRPDTPKTVLDLLGGLGYRHEIVGEKSLFSRG